MKLESLGSQAVKHIPIACLSLALTFSAVAIALAQNATPIVMDNSGKQSGYSTTAPHHTAAGIVRALDGTGGELRAEPERLSTATHYAELVNDEGDPHCY